MGQSCCVSNEEDKVLEASGRPYPQPTAESSEERHSVEPAMMDPLAGEVGVSAKDEGHELQKFVEVLVRKHGFTERLGMDVKHVRGRLVIAQVFSGGAVDRANCASLQASFAGDSLEVGDVIVQVNDKRELDKDMVAECQSSCDLRIRALRRFQS
mmetsp:Transcript_82525/g.237289  ORF Transcript_82525/g.237289 Transcript_82525/m.237289 type:complete len:155 (+) Transcript_82525:51-515(+)